MRKLQKEKSFILSHEEHLLHSSFQLHQVTFYQENTLINFSAPSLNETLCVVQNWMMGIR